MTDLHTRFRDADRIPAPDLWEEILTRRPRHIEPPPASIWPRLAAVTVALTIVGAASFLLVRAFFPEDAPQPGVTPTESPSPQESPPPDTFGPPRGIVALTATGDIMEIDHREGTIVRTIASFPPVDDPETSAGDFEAQDVGALPDGRFLVDTCCEPAGGSISIVAANGERSGTIIHGWDPHVASRLTIASIPWIAVYDLSAGEPERLIEVRPPGSGDPENASLSPDGDEIVFTNGGRLGVVGFSARSLLEASYLDPPPGKIWSSPAYTTSGVVAVESTGPWRGIGSSGSGPSRLLRVDLATGETTEIASTNGAITDVTVDQSGANLMWVQDGELVWQLDGETQRLEGDFYASAWIPARPS